MREDGERGGREGGRSRRMRKQVWMGWHTRCVLCVCNTCRFPSRNSMKRFQNCSPTTV